MIELTKEQKEKYKTLYNEFTTYISKDFILTEEDAKYQSPYWDLFGTYGVGGDWDKIEKEVG